MRNIVQVLLTTEAHFRRNSEGLVCSTTGGRGYSFWLRYLDVFDSVLVIGRLFLNEGPAFAPVEGRGVSFFPLPGYIGPQQYLWKAWALRQRIRLACVGESAFIARVPGAIGSLLLDQLKRRSWPYALEVVGDPHDAFAPGTIKHPFRAFFRWWFSHKLRRHCYDASAVAYVTQYALQRRYPPAKGNFSTYYSSIELGDSDFASEPRLYQGKVNNFTLINVGMMTHLYKAQDILIEALRRCNSDGLNLNLILVGDGKYRSGLESRVASLALKERVQFCGLLPAGDAVGARLDQADLFVLPSRQEGLPRALIEAMARALPCISSTVGGIPELLPSENLVPPNDVKELASKICEIVTDPERMSQMSARNLAKAKEYHPDVLRERRVEFYRNVKNGVKKSIKDIIGV